MNIRDALATHDFDWVQGSLYVSKTEDLAKLFAAITALKALPWLPASVRDIRAGAAAHNLGDEFPHFGSRSRT